MVKITIGILRDLELCVSIAAELYNMLIMVLTPPPAVSFLRSIIGPYSIFAISLVSRPAWKASSPAFLSCFLIISVIRTGILSLTVGRTGQPAKVAAYGPSLFWHSNGLRFE